MYSWFSRPGGMLLILLCIGCELFLDLDPDQLVENNEVRCLDGIDNDGDQLLDCEETDCLPFCLSCPGIVSDGEVFSRESETCYFFFEQTQRNWFEAQEICRALDGNLATIRSVEENDLLGSFLSDKNVWIGLNDLETEGLFLWDSFEDVVFSNFEDGEPNNSGGFENCVEMKPGFFQWNDQECIELSSFFCETQPIRRDTP